MPNNKPRKYRRVNETTTLDRIHCDLTNHLERTYRLTKVYRTDLATQLRDDPALIRTVKFTLDQIDSLSKASIEKLKLTIPLEISEHIAHKNLPVSRSRGYK